MDLTCSSKYQSPPKSYITGPRQVSKATSKLRSSNYREESRRKAEKNHLNNKIHELSASDCDRGWTGLGCLKKPEAITPSSESHDVILKNPLCLAPFQKYRLPFNKLSGQLGRQISTLATQNTGTGIRETIPRLIQRRNISLVINLDWIGQDVDLAVLGFVSGVSLPISPGDFANFLKAFF